MKLSARGQKILKIVHLVCAIAWIGSAIVMNTLRHLVDIDSVEGMYYVAVVLEAVDMDILVPGAILCLLTGVVYGLFTTWGFFKHRWLIVKWVLTVFMILFGTFYMGPHVKDNVSVGAELVERCGNDSGCFCMTPYMDLWDAYTHNVMASTWSGALQLVLLTVVVVVSVFKPWKKGWKTEKGDR